MALQPGFTRQIGGRHAFGQAPIDHFQEFFTFIGQHFGIEKGVERIEWQMQYVQQQVNRFIPGVVAAMTKVEFCGVELADGVTQQVANGKKFLEGQRIHGVPVC